MHGSPGPRLQALWTSLATWGRVTLLGVVGSHDSDPGDTFPPVFQGRAGSDGARGMPGQTGPKVGCALGLLASAPTAVVIVFTLMAWPTCQWCEEGHCGDKE